MKKSLRFLLFASLLAASFFSLSSASACGIMADDGEQKTDSDIFNATIYNDEEQVFIYMDFARQALVIPGQEVFGEMAGYFKTSYDSRYWMITSAEIDKKGRTATLEIINDYGSEDLTATLTFNPKDSTYTLRQSQGATIKFAKNRKWHKIPKDLHFKRK